MKRIEIQNKKKYVKPSIDVIEVEQSELICDSKIPPYYGPLG